MSIFNIQGIDQEGGEGGEREGGGVGNERKRIKAKEKKISVQMLFSSSYGFSNKKGYNLERCSLGWQERNQVEASGRNWNKKVDMIITDHSLELDS